MENSNTWRIGIQGEQEYMKNKKQGAQYMENSNTWRTIHGE